MTHFKQQLGFTLIEMMVVVGIIMMTTGGGIAAFIRFNDRQNLSSGSKALQTYLRGAQIKARSGDIPPGCDRLQGYRARLITGGGSVTLSAVCTNGVVLTDTYALPTGVVSENNHSIDFANLYGGVTGGGTVVLQANLLRYSFDVNDGGDISQGNFL